MTKQQIIDRLINYYLDTCPFDFLCEFGSEEHFSEMLQTDEGFSDAVENLSLEIEELEKEAPFDDMLAEDLEMAKNIMKDCTEYQNQTRYPVVFINCSEEPFIDRIISGLKFAETRTKDTLKNLVGKRVYLAETGKGKPIVRCSVMIYYSTVVENEYEWNELHFYTCVNHGGKYDWKPGTNKKVLYWIQGIEMVEPFLAVEGTRHGRAYMTY